MEKSKKTTLKELDKAWCKVWEALAEMKKIQVRLPQKDLLKTTLIGYYFNPESENIHTVVHIGTFDDVLAKGGLASLQERLYTNVRTED